MIDEFEERWGAQVIREDALSSLNGFWSVNLLFRECAIKWVASYGSSRACRMVLNGSQGYTFEISSVLTDEQQTNDFSDFVRFVLAYENMKLEKQRGADMKNYGILNKLFLNEGDEVKFYDCDYGTCNGSIREGRIVKAPPVEGMVPIKVCGENAIAYIPREHIIDVYR